MTFLQPGEYEQLRERGYCVQCKGKMLPEWPKGIRCPECHEQNRISTSRWVRSAAGRKYKREYNAVYYAEKENRDRRSANVRARRLAAKVSGKCIDCPLPITADSPYCAKHLEVHRAANKDYARRRREAKRTGKPIPLKPRKGGRGRTPIGVLKIRPIKPVFKARPLPSIDPVHDYRSGDITLTEAAIRAVELHNGITAREIGELFVADAKERNCICNALRRTLGKRLTVEMVDDNPMNRVFYPIRHRRAA